MSGALRCAAGGRETGGASCGLGDGDDTGTSVTGLWAAPRQALGWACEVQGFSRLTQESRNQGSQLMMLCPASPASSQEGGRAHIICMFLNVAVLVFFLFLSATSNSTDVKREA